MNPLRVASQVMISLEVTAMTWGDFGRITSPRRLAKIV
jgi:hypothetical protein